MLVSVGRYGSAEVVLGARDDGNQNLLMGSAPLIVQKSMDVKFRGPVLRAIVHGVHMSGGEHDFSLKACFAQSRLCTFLSHASSSLKKPPRSGRNKSETNRKPPTAYSQARPGSLRRLNIVCSNENVTSGAQTRNV